MNTILLIPGVLALLGGVLAYLYQLVQKRLAVIAMVETEVNFLLTAARENLDFLDRPTHYWLVVGTLLRTAPKAIVAPYRVLDALMKDLYVMGRVKAEAVLAFYQFHNMCERLREALFEQISGLKEEGIALTQEDVDILRARLQRLCVAYRTLEGSYSNTVAIRDLRPSYALPASQGVLKAIGSTNADRGDLCEGH